MLYFYKIITRGIEIKGIKLKGDKKNKIPRRLLK